MCLVLIAYEMWLDYIQQSMWGEMLGKKLKGCEHTTLHKTELSEKNDVGNLETRFRSCFLKASLLTWFSNCLDKTSLPAEPGKFPNDLEINFLFFLI